MTFREAKGLLATVKVRSQEVKQFYIHLATYLVANTFFLMMNIFEGPDGPIAMLPILFWGALLARPSRSGVHRPNNILAGHNFHSLLSG